MRIKVSFDKVTVNGNHIDVVTKLGNSYRYHYNPNLKGDNRFSSNIGDGSVSEEEIEFIKSKLGLNIATMRCLYCDREIENRNTKSCTRCGKTI